MGALQGIDDGLTLPICEGVWLVGSGKENHLSNIYSAGSQRRQASAERQQARSQRIRSLRTQVSLNSSESPR
jgi:hypothetical protein